VEEAALLWGVGAMAGLELGEGVATFLAGAGLLLAVVELSSMSMAAGGGSSTLSTTYNADAPLFMTKGPWIILAKVWPDSTVTSVELRGAYSRSEKE
jgi:hypothetical protein